MSRNVDSYADTYTSDPSFEPYMVKYRRRLILEFVEKWNPKRILEVGCGMEPLFPFLKEDLEYTVLEPAAKFAEHAGKLAEGKANVRVIKTTLEDSIPLLDGLRFDLILASGVLHEVPDPELFLQNIRGLTSSESRLHLNVPNSRSLHRNLGFKMGALCDFSTLSPRAMQLQQRTVFDKASLHFAVLNAGFRILEEGGYFIKPFTHEQMGKIVQAQIIDDSVLDALFDSGKDHPEFAAEIYINAALP